MANPSPTKKKTFKTSKLIHFIKKRCLKLNKIVFFFIKWIKFDVSKVLFAVNGFTISCILYFLACFHHDTKSKTGNEIGQKLNFLWFPHKFPTFRKSGKKFQAFWFTEVWSGYGSKKTTCCLNTLYVLKSPMCRTVILGQAVSF